MSDLIERVEAACRFPANTCGASRHAAQIGVALVRDEPYPMLDEEPAYCGESILSVVASLWEARTEIERLRAERDALAKALTFYATQEHFILSDDTMWDTVSGEPPNWWCDEAGTATVEDGSIARLVLAGGQSAADVIAQIEKEKANGSR